MNSAAWLALWWVTNCSWVVAGLRTSMAVNLIMRSLPGQVRVGGGTGADGFGRFSTNNH